ncbi:hypothetical protein A676_00907 [Salmonella enterica subsp. enterica serovar Enteritidis str. 2010K-0262]|nr:hypothetical protein A672_03283 [Salmonella enterica subsp. enterica serovar Enteritidis str. 08-1080]EPI89425.1 hypothetical protein A676_00907 [Salmonella enterica subsp. enterica serovar Enteritidis str. 2010K-0262]EPI99485.1 hypothetical protein A679_02909 [Salmonella enterica subsp. enterica serovar Enteritidis str. 2010K-0284]EPJ09613.1 hypothetical protein A680_03333 [Salmonella enterica subsp. enterica serovar Enteritidis str. 2010K-0286]
MLNSVNRYNEQFPLLAQSEHQYSKNEKRRLDVYRLLYMVVVLFL